MFREEKDIGGSSSIGKAQSEIKESREEGASRAPIFAIDLGSRKVRAVAGWVDKNGKVDIIGVKEAESNGISKGVITDPQATSLDIRAVLEELSLFLADDIRKVFVSIPANHTKRFTFGSNFLRKKSKQPLNQEEVAGYIKQTLDQIEIRPGEKLIHFFPQEFFIDGKGGIKNPVGMKGKEIDTELQVVVGQLPNIQNIINCLDKAGLEVIGLIPSYMASSDAVLSEDDKAEGVAVLDIGAAATQLAIYRHGFLRYSGVIPFGSGIITEDIKDGLFIIRKEAELLKMKTGSALSDGVKENEFSTIRLKGEPKEVAVKNLARIIQARMEEILDMAILEIKNSGFDSELKKGIVVTGGGAQLKNLTELVNRHSGFPVRLGYPVERLAGGIDMEYRNPGYSTAIGLLLKGHESMMFKI